MKKVNWKDNPVIITEYTREDVNNMFPPAMPQERFVKSIINYLLGEEWCVADPISPDQVSSIALDKILYKYSKKYRKEMKAFDKYFDKIYYKVGSTCRAQQIIRDELKK